MRLPALFIALATALHAAVPLKDPRITGTDAKVSSGTFTIKSGATLAAEAGAIFAFAEKVPLSAGGTGVSLSDPGADRILFWDDSAGALTWLTIGSGLSLTGTTLTTDATAAAPPDATYITQTANGTLTNEFAMGTLATGLVKNTTTTGVPSIAVAGTDYVPPGAATASGLTMATAKLLGRTTASTGAIEEITIGSNLSLASTTLDLATSPTITTPTISGAITFPAGVKQTFAPNGTTAGINVGSVAGDPSTPANGDLWYDSTANELTARINGANVALGAGGGGGSVATDTIWNVKGDLAVGTGSDTASRLAVGSNGQVLMADSAESTGVKWATASGTGDVVGPASSTDARLALFDSTTGKLLKQSTALTESGGTITSNTAIGLTAGGTNQNITLTPSGTGAVRAVNRLYVGEGSAAFGGYQSLILAREGSSYGGALGIHHGDNPTDNFAWTFQRARGTLASPSAVQSGDRLGQFTFSGYNGSGFGNAAAILSDTTENWSGSARGAKLVFATTANGTTTRTDRVFIQNSGLLEATAGLYVSGGDIQADKTITAGGTTGAQTINKNAGSVNFAASASSLVVTNSRVTTSSVIIATVATNDSTMKSVAVVAGAGSFTIHANAAATAETRVNFFIVN